MAKRNMFVGMDVHKASIDIALAEEGGRWLHQRDACDSCTRPGL